MGTIKATALKRSGATGMAYYRIKINTPESGGDRERETDNCKHVPSDVTVHAKVKDSAIFLL